MGAVALLVVVLAMAIGGGGSTSGSGGGGNAATSGPAARPALAPMPAPKTAAGEGAAATGSAGGAADAGPSVPDAGSKVVKTGEVDLQVASGQVPHTMDRLIALATLERGFVAESHSSEGGSPSGSVTLRMPVQSFESTVAQVRQLTGKVLSQQTSGQDVTSSYVDLQARLRSLTATRSAFERLLARATTIGDTLAVQSRITDVQTQIEQLQGQLRVMTDQTSYGTLTVTVSEKGTAPARPHQRSGMSRAFHRSVDRFVGGLEAMVGVIGPLLLVVLVVAIGWGAARLVYRLLRRRTA